MRESIHYCKKREPEIGKERRAHPLGNGSGIRWRLLVLVAHESFGRR